MTNTTKAIAVAIAAGIALAAFLGFLNDRDMHDFGKVPATTTTVMANITTTNTPDGKCHEDDPCWNPATVGDHCWAEPNASQPDGIEVICAGPQNGEGTIEFDGKTFALGDPQRPACWRLGDGVVIRLAHLVDAPQDGLEVLCDGGVIH